MMAGAEWQKPQSPSQTEVGPRGHQNFQFPEIQNKFCSIHIEDTFFDFFSERKKHSSLMIL